MKKIIIIVLIIVAVLIIGISLFNSYLSPTSKETNIVSVEILKGNTITSIAKTLKDKNIIRNEFVFKIYCKIKNINNLQAGKYELDTAESMPQIIEHIANGEIITDEIRITFVEGRNMKYYAKEIAKHTKNSEEDVFDLLENEEYIDSLIEKYWFLEKDIKHKDIYYPLEGYLLPDTYTFEDEEVSVETIFAVILNHMEKFLEEYKDYFTYNVHNTLTLASIAELEGKTMEDRQEIIGVFFNRINKKRSLGSDVTTYYAFGIEMYERDLTLKELNTYNSYNTRGPNMDGKIPIGPICNPSKEAIKATLDPIQTEAMFFVSDKNGKIYFTNTNKEHEKMIAQLKKEGLWYTY